MIINTLRDFCAAEEEKEFNHDLIELINIRWDMIDKNYNFFTE